MKKVIAILIVFVGFSTYSFGQITASSDAYATIVTPINLQWEVDLNFGNLAVTTVPGDVELVPSGNIPPTRNVTGGVTLPNVIGTVTAAKFSVTGTPMYTYAITLPASCIIKNNNGAGPAQMTVDVFTSLPTPTGQLNSSGLQTLYVGATVHVLSSQAAGIYKSPTPFNVTVNYN